MVVQGSEYVTEAFYSWWIVKYLNLRPSVQYVVQPGGTSRNSNILVIGLRTAAVF